MNTLMNDPDTLELSMTEVRNRTAARYEQVYEQAMRSHPDADLNEKKILTLLYNRQTEALCLLDGIRARAEEIPVQRAGVKKAGILRRVGSVFFQGWIDLVTSPFTRLVLCSLILIGSVLSAFVPFIRIVPPVLSVLMICLLVTDILQKNRNTPEKPAYRCHTYMMRTAQTGFAEKMSKTFENDTRTILRLFQNVNLNSDNRTRQFAAEMYQKIYRAFCENPRLRSLLDRAETILWSYGLEAIPYSPENAAYYDVQEEDCPSQTVFPAVCRKADKLIISKGEYYLNRNEI